MAELLLALVLVLQFQELVLLQVAFLVELVALQRDLRPVLLQDVHTKICREEKKMKFINEKDKKRSMILFLMLIVSLFFVPYISNPGIRFAISFLLVILFINAVVIIGKLFKYIKKHKK